MAKLPDHYVMVRPTKGGMSVELTFKAHPHLRWVAEFRDGTLVGSDGDENTPEGVSWRDCLDRAFQALSHAEDDAENESDRLDSEWA